MRKIRNLVFMLGALVLFLAACTSGTKKSTTTATTQTQPSTTTTTTTVVQPTTTTKAPTTTTKVVTDQELIDAVVMEHKKTVYNGEAQSIECTNLPEGATVTYKNNDKKYPGTYKVTATILYNGNTYEKTATLKIEKVTISIEAETEQVLYINDELGRPAYNIVADSEFDGLENAMKVSKVYKDSEGNVLPYETYRTPGEYTLEIGVTGNLYCKSADTVTINFTVKDSDYNVEFNNAKFTKDGTEKSITATAELPTGYSIEYENNTATDAGNYFATANVLDDKGNVVEKHYATLTIENPKNAEFEKYLDEFFVLMLEDDQISINIFCENPTDFGLLAHYPVSWYTYTPIEDLEAETKLAIEEFEGYLEELYAFKDAELSPLQEVSYDKIEDFLLGNLNKFKIEDYYYYNNTVYVNQFGGYVADFGTYMEAYTLRDEQDIKDVITFCETTEEAFKSYLLHAKDMADAGYPLSDFTIDSMINYLNDVLADKDDYYLKTFLINKINAFEGISDDAKASYVEQITKAIDVNFMNGVEALKNGLPEFKGLCQEEGYIAVYEHGKEYYMNELTDLLGITVNSKSYVDELETAIKESGDKVSEYVNRLAGLFGVSTYAELEAEMAKHPIFDGTPEEMMEYLKEFAPTIVPDLQTEPNIYIKNMDLAAAEVSNAVAYYMKSALDNTSTENITLNTVKLGDKNDVLGTLAHEGYPGHLYAYCFSKELDLHNISKILTSTAHGEGWATYVELALYQYAIENTDDETVKAICQYLYYNQLSGFLLETRLDFGVLYQNWKPQQISSYLGANGYNDDIAVAQELYQLLIETPASYPAYGYGKLVFYNLHEEAKSILGDVYDEVEFNAMLLSKGWTDLGYLKETYNEYMMIKCHQYGIEFNA